MSQSNELKVIREHNVMVPMRDGVRLATDIIRPDLPGRFPVLVTRSPYGKGNEVNNPEHANWFWAKQGYVVVSQDCRARFDSEGDRYNPLFQEVQDGYDTVEWAARQIWSNGRVGTTGQSYLGATQYTIASGSSLPPHLQAMAPVSAAADFHQGWVYHTGGVMEWGWMVPYAILKGRNTLARQGREDLLAQMDEYVEMGDNFAQPLRDEWYRHLPLKDWVDRLKEAAPYFKEFLENDADGPYWWRINLMKHAEKIKVPMFHVSSWYDIFLEGALDAYQALGERSGGGSAKNNQKMLIGPWAHIGYTTPTSGGTGDIDFGEEAKIELLQFLLRWFDYWLKDIDSGIMDEPPVRIFVMGENRWRTEQEWPLARTHYIRYYFHSDGPANSRHGTGTLSTAPPGGEQADTYRYDPEDPTPTRGGNTLILPVGVADHGPVEDREDVLVYTSVPLERDLEVTGPIKVHLFASSSAVDTDFTAKLVDVRPDGYAQNIQDGIIRARYRTSGAQPSLIEPGRAYQFTIDLWATSHLFKAGHQLRVEISSSNFPRFDRNPNTGAPLGSDARMEVAHQTVYHSAAHPSHIILPIIPR